MEADINLPFITMRDGQPVHLVMKLSRAKLEELVGDLIKNSFKPVEEALKDAKLSKTDIEEVVLVGGMTRMPKIVESVKEFFGKEPNRSVNPDEVVAIGAAVQAGVLTGETKDVVLLDVTPLTLGVETMGSVSTPMITRNTTIPTSKSEVYSTAADNQTQVEIHILQGERPMARDNKSLGRFILEGIPPAPRGVPQIEVTFDIDANGILTVIAKDKATGKEQSIKITGSTGLTKEEIEKMKKDAEENEAKDKETREKIEIKNKADALVYTAEKSLKDAGDKAPEDLKKEIEDKIKAVKDLGEDAAVADIEAKSNELSDSLQKLGPHMSQQPAADGAAPAGDAKTGDDKGDEKTSDKKDVEEGEVVS
jgi:molecular chaperone DnaK